MTLSLIEIAQKYKTDKGTTHSYLDTYERVLSQFRDLPITLLEIGVAGGGSMSLWLEYFPNAQIIGLDIHLFKKVQMDFAERPRLRLIECDQLNKEKLNELFEDESIDVIIDDGSHVPEHQALTHNFLWPKLKSGGVYFVEDVMNFLWKDYCGYWTTVPNAIVHPLHKNGRRDDILVVIHK